MSFIENITKQQVAGVCIHLLEDSYAIGCTVIEQYKDQLNVIEKFDGVKDFQSLVDQLPKNIPVQLCIIGKGVISRGFKPSENLNLSDVIHEIMPGIDINQVYYSYLKNDGAEYNEIGIARKELINNILKDAKNAGLFVTDVFMGLASLHTLNDLTDLSSVSTKHYSIKFDKYFQINYSDTDSESSHNIGDDRIEGSFVLSYSVSLQWFVKNGPQGNLDKVNAFNKAEFIAHKRFVYTAVSGLAVLFIALLINMFVFSKQTKEFDEYDGFLQLNQKAHTKLESLIQEVELKKKHLFDNNLLSGTRFSYFGDKIGQLTPGSISLTRLNIFPLETSKSKKQNIIYRKNLILITGLGKSAPIQDFIDKLKTEEWIIDVDLKDFAQINKSSNISFTLYVYTQ